MKEKPVLIFTIILILIAIGASFIYHSNVLGFIHQPDLYTEIDDPFILETDGFYKDLSYSLFQNYDDKFNSLLLFFTLLATEILLIIYLIKTRKKLTVKFRKIKIFVYGQILMVLFFAYLFLVLPAISAEILKQSATEEIKSVLQDFSENENVEIVYDYNLATKKIESLQNPLKLVSSYGHKGVTLPLMFSEKDSFSFYEAFVIPHSLADNKFDLSLKKDDGLIFFDSNTLITGSGSKDFLEIVGPVLFQKIAKDSYSSYITNKLPSSFEVINQSEFSDQAIQKEKELLEKEIERSLNDIAFNNNIVIENERLQRSEESLLNQDEVDYQQNCIESVNYNNCPEFRQQIDNNTIIIRQNSVVRAEDKRVVENNNSDIQIYIADLEKRIREIESESFDLYTIADGLFVQPSTILVREREEMVLAHEYIQVLLHEMLHFYSHSTTSYLPTFIDEGLTDYFTFKALGINSIEDKKYWTGYLSEIGIIDQILTRVSEETLIDIYFRKDEIKLKNILEKEFGLNYPKFVQLGEQLLNLENQLNVEDKLITDSTEGIELRDKVLSMLSG